MKSQTKGMKSQTKANLAVLLGAIAAVGAILLPNFMPSIVGGPSGDFRVGEHLDAKSGPTRSAGTLVAIKVKEWEDLVPKDWDPLKDFKALNLQNLLDSDPRAMRALDSLMESWRNAPVRADLVGASLRLPGFVIPLEQNKGQMSEFLLVPYFGACIHTPPPPSNQIIHGVLDKPVAAFRSMDAAWVTGVLDTTASSTSFGNAGYRLRVQQMEPYQDTKR